MFKNLINKGLPMSLLLVVSAIMQGFAVRAFADDAAMPTVSVRADSLSQH